MSQFCFVHMLIEWKVYSRCQLQIRTYKYLIVCLHVYISVYTICVCVHTEHWFSSRGGFISRGHLPMSGNIFVCPSRGLGCSWHLWEEAWHTAYLSKPRAAYVIWLKCQWYWGWSQILWSTLVIPALGKRRQRDQKFRVIFCYVASLG